MKWIVFLITGMLSFAFFTFEDMGKSSVTNKTNTTFSIEFPNEAPEREETVKSAFKVLINTCPELMTFKNDIDNIKAEISPYLYQSENHGWDEWVRFEVSIADNTTGIPNQYRANGHHLWYSVGGAPTPGIEVTKNIGGQFCGKGLFEGFISVPAAENVWSQQHQ